MEFGDEPPIRREKKGSLFCPSTTALASNRSRRDSTGHTAPCENDRFEANNLSLTVLLGRRAVDQLHTSRAVGPVERIEAFCASA